MIGSIKRGAVPKAVKSKNKECDCELKLETGFEKTGYRLQEVGGRARLCQKTRSRTRQNEGNPAFWRTRLRAGNPAFWRTRLQWKGSFLTTKGEVTSCPTYSKS